jgi:hypothetical protein
MGQPISTGQGIAVAGVWVAVAAVAVASLPFAVLVFPLVVPVAAAWGGLAATRLLLGRRPARTPDGIEAGADRRD